MEYKIIVAYNTVELEQLIQAFLNDGWDRFMPIVATPELFLAEMTRVKKEDSELPYELIRERKVKKLAELDPYLKDLLEINNISIQCDDLGRLSVSCGSDGKTVGFLPILVLNLLRNSKHVPIDLDEEKILNELEKLL